MTQRQPGDYVVNAELTNEQRERFVKDCVAAGVDRIFQDCKSHKYTSLMRPLSNLVVGTTFLEGGNHAYWKGYSNNVTHEYKDNAMTHNNEPTWTDWLPNPGTGECPVPEWAEKFRVLCENRGRDFGIGGNPEKVDWYVNHKYGDVTHYAYAVPADLAELAKRESLGGWSDIKWAKVKSCTMTTWTVEDWLRARRDLGYEQDDDPAERRFNAMGVDIGKPNFRSIQQPDIETENTNNTLWQDSDGCDSHYQITYKGIKLDPYRIAWIYNMQGGPREQILKKCLRFTDKGQTEREVVGEIEKALQRWKQMLEEDSE